MVLLCSQEIARLKEQDPKMNHKRAFSMAADSVKPLAPLVQYTLAALLLLLLLSACAESVHVLMLYTRHNDFVDTEGMRVINMSLWPCYETSNQKSSSCLPCI